MVTEFAKVIDFDQVSLLEKIRYIRKDRHLTGFLHRICYFTLEFQAVSGNTTGQHLALLVQKLLQKLAVFVVNVLNAIFLETAEFLRALFGLDGGQVFDFVLCHD